MSNTLHTLFEYAILQQTYMEKHTLMRVDKNTILQDIERTNTVLIHAVDYLASLQQADGNFEGQLSSSTFPSCAYAWIQLAQGNLPKPSLIEWFRNNQNEHGAWGLDTANQSNPDATLFARIILEQVGENSTDVNIQDIVSQIPAYTLHLALVKLAYATFNRFDWQKLTVPNKALPLMRLVTLLKRIPMLGALLKPPRHKLPPVDLFNTSLFDELFIAEQHTLVPVFILIELNTSHRIEVVDSLVSWLKTRVLGDGSWFRVNYITALSVLSLIEVDKTEHNDSDIPVLIDNGIDWLQSTENPDGGYREAINLNVWDTALSIIAMTDIDNSTINNSDAIQKAAQWLVDHQNGDGGWAFSGLRDDTLPSDADDTALATLAIIRSNLSSPDANISIQQGIEWLLENQGSNGSWSTYQPGQGDVGCVSITAHAIETLLAYGNNDKAINSGIEWLCSAIHRDGFWNDLWLAKRTYGTACAITALVKVGFMDAPEILRGIQWLEQVQNDDGGWGEDMFGNATESTVEQTAWCTYAILLVNGITPSAQGGINYLLERQNDDGSWHDSCIGIYWEVIGGYSDPIYASVFPILALNQYTKQKAQ